MINALNAINAKNPRTNGKRAAAFNLNNNNNGNKSFFVFLPLPRAAFPNRKQEPKHNASHEKKMKQTKKKNIGKVIKIAFRLEHFSFGYY